MDLVAGKLSSYAMEEGACSESSGPRSMFMQSNGGLTDANLFQGKDAILSGPAGGVVGMVRTAGMSGYDKLIGFDMGGTSTDVTHYNGEFDDGSQIQAAIFVDDDIPLNEGCLKPLEIIIPKASMISPEYPAAVISGNTEVSQAIRWCGCLCWWWWLWCGVAENCFKKCNT